MPAAVVAVGLTATLQYSASRADRVEAERDLAEAALVSEFASTADDKAELVRAEAARIDVIVHTLLAAGDGEFSAVVEGLDVFDAGPSIQAVSLSSGVESQLELPEGSLDADEVPGLVRGITATTEGRWANTLTYRVFDPDSSVRSVAVVVDLESALDPLVDSTVASAELSGLPGLGEVQAATPSMVDVGAGVFLEPEAQALSSARPIAVLGDTATLDVVSPVGHLVVPESNEVRLVMSLGLLLTAILGIATWAATRRLLDLLSTRDHVAAAREAAIARFEASFTNAPMGVVEIDADGDVLAVNPRFASKLGYLPEELLGTRLLDLVDGADRKEATEQMADIRAHGSTADQAERRYRTMNGSAVWMKESVSAIDAADGSRHILIQVEDISDDRRSRAELRRRALFDELTGLPNRAHLISQLRLAVDTADTAGDDLAVMFVDLNKFKAINDTLGHEAGDQILVEVAERLRSVCRAGDTVARLGGDEFVIVCQGITSQEMAATAAARYFEVLNQPTVIDGSEVEISASVGLVVADGDAQPEELLRNADKAMYQAKATNSETVVEFDYSMQAETVDRLSQEVALRKAIENNELELYFQTIVHGATSDIVGVEALVRWNHPRNGLTAPGEFLPLAEEIGVLEEIDRWAIEEGVASLARWSQTSDVAAKWFLTVNTSACHFATSAFADWVIDLLVEAGVEPRRLVLERPEQTAYGAEASARATIRELRSRGVRISLDHFGVGQTPLAELSGLEVDSLKIGRSFVSTATSREQSVLKAIAEMARSLGFEVVAEGIESQSELDLVLGAGVHYAQGFHFSRPVDGDTLVARTKLHERTPA